MVERTIVVTNRAGIHCRPAAILVQAANSFKANIYFEQGKRQINAKSIMGLLTLGATYGTEIKIVGDGEDEQQAVESIIRLCETNFEEE